MIQHNPPPAMKLSPQCIPAFGADPWTVGGWTIPGTETVARILVPLEARPEVYLSWAELSSTPVCGLTRHSSLVLNPSVDVPAGEVWLPYGYVDSQTARRIVSVLDQATTQRGGFIVGVSQVYCDDELPCRVDKVSAPSPEPWFITALYADLYRCETLSWVQNLTKENQIHFPVMIWPLDLSWSLAAPLYSDSWFFAGPQTVRDALSQAGLELYPVSRHDETPAEGD